MRPWEIIQKLETDNSRLFKEGVVSDYIADADFRQGLQWALNPLVTFGVQQVPVSELDWLDDPDPLNLLSPLDANSLASGIPFPMTGSFFITVGKDREFSLARVEAAFWDFVA